MEGPQLMVLWDWLFQMITFQKITENLTSIKSDCLESKFLGLVPRKKLSLTQNKKANISAKLDK